LKFFLIKKIFFKYFPKETPIFSTSGCKQIERRADFMYAEVIREQHFLASQYNDEI